MKLITDTKLLNKAITSIRGRGKKLDKDIHIAAVSCIAHIKKHRDVTVANSLIDAMPKGSRTNALRAFLEHFGQVSYDEKAKAMVFDRDKTADVQGAIEKPWTEFKPEPVYTSINISAELNRLLSRISKAEKAGKQTFDPQDVESVKALAKALAPEAKAA